MDVNSIHFQFIQNAKVRRWTIVYIVHKFGKKVISVYNKHKTVIEDESTIYNRKKHDELLLGQMLG